MTSTRFWKQNDKGDFVISRGLLIDFLTTQGFGTFSESTSRTDHGSLVKVDGNILKPHDLKSMRKWVQGWIQDNVEDSEKEAAIDAFYRFREFQDDLTTPLPIYSTNDVEGSRHIDFAEDNSMACRIPFKNGVVEVTAETIQLKPISVVNELGHLWEAQIKSHSIKSKDLGTFDVDDDFPHFIKYAMGIGEEPKFDKQWRGRMNSLETAIGYLAHRYNDPSVPKAVIFVDKESHKGSVEGGNGKSVVAEGLSTIVPSTKVDGHKAGNLIGTKDGKFVFSGFISGSRLLILDDCSDKLKFDALFGNITGSLEVERKGKDTITIPYSKKPKFLITTNHVLPKMGTSHIRRQHIVEFGNYWNLMFRKGTEPIDMYKRRFFSEDWGEVQWNNFYNYLFTCIQTYLKSGLIETSLASYRQKQVKIAIEGNRDIGFVEWMDKWVKQDRLKGNFNHKPGISFSSLYFKSSEDLPDLPTLDWFKDAVWRYCEQRKYGFNDFMRGNTRSTKRYRPGSRKGGQQEHIVLTTPDDVQLAKAA